MRKRVIVCKVLPLVGTILFVSVESQAFCNHHYRHLDRHVGGRTDSYSWKSRFGSISGTNNSGGRKGGDGGGKDISSLQHDDAERPDNQSIPWVLLGTSVLSKSLEGTEASSACQAAAAMSVSTVMPTSPSKFTWQQVLSVALVLMQAWRVGAIHQGFSNGIRQSMAWYLVQLDTNPIVTKAITAGVVGFFGDYLAQWLEFSIGRHGRGSNDGGFIQKRLLIHGTYDFRRSAGILFHGIVVTGPLMHWGYGLFEQIIPTTPSSSSSSAAVMGKASQSLAAISHVLADSTFLDGIFTASTYIVTGITEGIKKDELFEQFRKDYFPSLKASWAASFLLAPLEFAYFRFLPVPLRPLFMNLNDIVWDAVISFMAHRSRHHQVLV